ncbi:EF-hand domain-containing protein [Streptomyces kunmingensis]|uniref:EF-hand domain-containing protein n=1 Tax=Streptomyces kunmingensis TaxID=68225 RepID=A0ABU6CCQ8_9ACTN|nr:EF-hand domain-containing protein [Streptomyces kunmingensis]MEB3962500.1 EF-hand domain-containing protein [Streptomyces kunmingensis]
MPAKDFLMAKMDHAFDLLDADGDGVLTEADHVLMGRRSAKELNHAPGSPMEKALIDAYRSAWHQAHAHNADSEGRVTREVYVGSVSALFADAALTDQVCDAVLESVMGVADVEGVGEIDPDAYRAFVLGQSPALTRGEVDESFRQIDRDGAGVISKTALKQAVVEYFTSSDPHAPGNWLFGRPPVAARQQ